MRLILQSKPNGPDTDKGSSNSLSDRSGDRTSAGDSSAEQSGNPDVSVRRRSDRNSSSSLSESMSGEERQSRAVKKTTDDFIFGKVIGEGSYSTVSQYWLLPW